jgi:hypothetical protein
LAQLTSNPDLVYLNLFCLLKKGEEPLAGTTLKKWAVSNTYVKKIASFNIYNFNAIYRYNKYCSTAVELEIKHHIRDMELHTQQFICN